MLESKAPLWMKVVVGIFGSGMMILLAWVLLSVHTQEGSIKDLRSDISSTMNDMKISNIKSSARLAGRFEILATELKNIKETSINRSADRYTGSQARARKDLMDERCGTMKQDLNNIKLLIEKYHK